jgi:hypothetical protein
MRRSWPISALLTGTLPPTVGYAFGSALHQPVTGLLLATGCLSCVWRDQLCRALLLVAIVMGAHSCVAILLSLHDPAGAAAMLAGSQAYWEQTRTWLRTGDDPEYQLAVWLPLHLLLFGSIVIGGGLTLGVAPLVEGVQHVDLMNFYVGRLVAQSESPLRVLLFGWHPWSILRGLACTVLVFECASWTLERVTRKTVTTSSRRSTRLVLSAALAVADALTKSSLAPIVREQLYQNLWPDFQ